ncbi:hypothetical protein LCGC14_2401800 [marine sediment metagenome]|uniref:Uncharacterized protein n=1 Tax=marine sediment metagenome TaxID=412755 RepID=A0A0F9EPK5_9ZZZZ
MGHEITAVPEDALKAVLEGEGAHAMLLRLAPYLDELHTQVCDRIYAFSNAEQLDPTRAIKLCLELTTVKSLREALVGKKLYGESVREEFE